MVAPVTPVETGTPVDPGNASGDELQRLSKIPGGAAGCCLAAGALTSCDASRAFSRCNLRVIDAGRMQLESRQYFPRIKRSIQPIG